MFVLETVRCGLCSSSTQLDPRTPPPRRLGEMAQPVYPPLVEATDYRSGPVRGPGGYVPVSQDGGQVLITDFAPMHYSLRHSLNCRNVVLMVLVIGLVAVVIEASREQLRYRSGQASSVATTPATSVALTVVQPWTTVPPWTTARPAIAAVSFIATSPARSSSTVIVQTTSLAYDCYSQSRAEWTVGKAEWCCQRYGYACATTTTTLSFDCDIGYLNWITGWSSAKKVWCCSQTDRGCPTTQTTTSILVTTTAVDTTKIKGSVVAIEVPSTTVTATHYDCHDVLRNRQASWSDDQRRWCCQHYSRGCPTKPIRQSTRLFDCDNRFGAWETKWSPFKQRWCCEHRQRGCPTTTSYLLYACGTTVPPSGWSQHMREWCCKATGRGCPTTTPIGPLRTSHEAS